MRAGTCVRQPPPFGEETTLSQRRALDQKRSAHEASRGQERCLSTWRRHRMRGTPDGDGQQNSGRPNRMQCERWGLRRAGRGDMSTGRVSSDTGRRLDPESVSHPPGAASHPAGGCPPADAVFPPPTRPAAGRSRSRAAAGGFPGIGSSAGRSRTTRHRGPSLPDRETVVRTEEWKGVAKEPWSYSRPGSWTTGRCSSFHCAIPPVMFIPL